MTPRARIGHFNDGFLASESHGGTFGRGDSLVPADAEKTIWLKKGVSCLWTASCSGVICAAYLPTEAVEHGARWHYDTFGFVHGHSCSKATSIPSMSGR